MKDLRGELTLNYTEEARRFKNSKSSSQSTLCLDATRVRTNAEAEVRRLGGSVSDELNVLGQYTLQFGIFKGQSFKWLLENGIGYAGWLVDNMRNEPVTTAPLSINKNEFKKYLNSFAEGRSVVAIKKTERLKKTGQIPCQSKI